MKLLTRWTLVITLAFLNTGCASFMRFFAPAPPPPVNAPPALPMETTVQLHEELLLVFMDRHPPAQTVLGPVSADGELADMVVDRLRQLGYGVSEEESSLPFHISVRAVNGGGHVAAIVQGGPWTLTRSYALSTNGTPSLISSTMSGPEE